MNKNYLKQDGRDIGELVMFAFFGLAGLVALAGFIAGCILIQ